MGWGCVKVPIKKIHDLKILKHGPAPLASGKKRSRATYEETTNKHKVYTLLCVIAFYHLLCVIACMLFVIRYVIHQSLYYMQFQALELYRRMATLRRKRKLDPETGKVYGKIGMAQCCRQVEKENNLRPSSISKSTINRWHRQDVSDVSSALAIRPGIAPVLPMEFEENLIKLVLACDARGDQKAGPPVVRRAVGLYMQGTAFEKDFKERYPGRWKEDKGIIVPGQTWMDNWYKRMKQLPAYKKIVKCRGRGVDVDKLRNVLYLIYYCHYHALLLLISMITACC